MHDVETYDLPELEFIGTALLTSSTLLGPVGLRDLHLESECLGDQRSVRDRRLNLTGGQQLQLLTAADTHANITGSK